MKNGLKKIKQFMVYNLRTVARMVQCYPIRTGVLLFISLLLPLEEIVTVKYSEFLTNSIAEMQSGYKMNTVLLYALLFLVILLLLCVSKWVFDIVYNWYAKYVGLDVDETLLNKLAKIKYEYFENTDTYHKITLSQEAARRYPTSLFVMTMLLNYIIRLVVYYVMLGDISLYLVVLVTGAIAVTAAVGILLIKKFGNFYADRVIPLQRKTNYYECIAADRVNHANIQINRQIGYFAERYSRCADEERACTMKGNLFNFGTGFVSVIGFGIAFVLMLLFCGTRIVSGENEIGLLTLVSGIMMSIYSIVNGLIHFAFDEKEYIQVVQAYEEIMGYEEREEAIVSRNDLEAELAINNLTYRYGNGPLILKGVTKQFRKGEKISIVGANGSGKTTFVSVLLGLLEGEKGAVQNTIGRCAAILQDFPSYAMTVRENIELGGAKLSDEEMYDILKKVELYEKVKSLPKGLDTELGQLTNGVELSKGQYQRLAMAKLLADKEANIWILDEPTAFLDPMAEIEMYKSILELGKEKTIFFISHRLGFTKYSDRILFFRDGRVAEDGTHGELMKNSGMYSEMYELQKEWYE
ncbi:MAG: ABC transporter ATP-binding protein [Lachnospiraceae bacterium]|nr:ABC transporter ATP-binding protein [Lachnospiraceae bacterium]